MGRRGSGHWGSSAEVSRVSAKPPHSGARLGCVLNSPPRLGQRLAAYRGRPAPRGVHGRTGTWPRSAFGAGEHRRPAAPLTKLSEPKPRGTRDPAPLAAPRDRPLRSCPARVTGARRRRHQQRPRPAPGQEPVGTRSSWGHASHQDGSSRSADREGAAWTDRRTFSLGAGHMTSLTVPPPPRKPAHRGITATRRGGVRPGPQGPAQEGVARVPLSRPGVAPSLPGCGPRAGRCPVVPGSPPHCQPADLVWRMGLGRRQGHTPRARGGDGAEGPGHLVAAAGKGRVGRGRSPGHNGSAMAAARLAPAHV